MTHLVINTGEAAELATTELPITEVVEILQNRLTMIPVTLDDMTGLEDMPFVDDKIYVTPWSVVYFFELETDAEDV